MEIAEDEPLMKKQKTEDSLEPELQFMLKFKVNSSTYIFKILGSSTNQLYILGSCHV